LRIDGFNAEGLSVRILVTMSCLCLAAPAIAQDASEEQRTRTVLIGGVIDWKPAFPGADGRDQGFFPLIAIWNDGERMPVETPDESLGINFIGDDEGTSAGLVLTGNPRRRARDVGLDLRNVGFGVEAGGFAQTWVGDHLRLRTEVRQGLGGHGSLTGDVAADFVYRQGDDVHLTLGPRLRWGSAGHQRRYFGVTADEALATGLTAYRPGAGLYAYGAVASAHVHVTPNIGLYAYGGYDRLSGDAARSPIVRTVGNRDQASFGVGLSYRFQVNRRPRSQ
jgi:MipA family protein